MNTAPKYLRPDDLAERWEVSTGTLSNWRSRGVGPTFVKIGASVRYALVDVEGYEAAGRIESLA